MEPLKDQLFNAKFYHDLSVELKNIYPTLDKQSFDKAVQYKIDELELMDRLYLVSTTLREFLPKAFPEAVEIVNRLGERVENGFAGMAFCDFVARYGSDHFDLSMTALHHLTRYSSAEFAIRYFLRDEFDKTIAVMKTWATDKNVHVRRLASEGARPRLPWSFKLDRVIQDPDCVLPILNLLSEDEELYVKKSVGNHLNDISKDHPQKAVEVAREWGLDNEHTAWIVKRGLRTLVKKGNPEALEIFGVHKDSKVEIDRFELSDSVVKIGDFLDLVLEFTAQRNESLIIDFIVHYKKKLGEWSPKVFKWKELTVQEGECISMNKKLNFKDLSTRKHYAGIHKVELMINGDVKKSLQFALDE